MTLGSVSAFVELNNGIRMPRVGLGTWRLNGAEGENAIRLAIESGYRSIDTAAQYGNEEIVGRAIRLSGAPRADLFVTTKLANSDHQYDIALKAFAESLERLGLDYVDLYLIHWPAFQQDRFVEAWRALEAILRSDRVRAIGVSNFTVGALKRLLSETETVPAVNQIELHPEFGQTNLRAFHAEHGIATEAWKPLGRGLALREQKAVELLAEKYDKTCAQIVIRWHLEQGHVVIPKSSNPSRIRENLDVFDFELEKLDMDALKVLDSGQRLGEDPEKVN